MQSMKAFTLIDVYYYTLKRETHYFEKKQLGNEKNCRRIFKNELRPTFFKKLQNEIYRERLIYFFPPEYPCKTIVNIYQHKKQ